MAIAIVILDGNMYYDTENVYLPAIAKGSVNSILIPTV
jgi:hypothetical protein